MTRRRLSRIFWIGAAAILVAAALVALVAIVRGDFSETDGRILVTLGALLYTGGAATAGLALVDRGRARALGWTVAGAAPVAMAFVLWAVWSFVFEQDDHPADKLAWSGVVALLAGLLAVVALLLARRPALERLAAAAGALAAVAASLSIAGIWAEPEGDALVKVVGALWILAVLAFFLVPVLQRFSNVGAAEEPVRVLAEIGGVELVATLSYEGTIDPELRPGERLALRRKA